MCASGMCDLAAQFKRLEDIGGWIAESTETGVRISALWDDDLSGEMTEWMVWGTGPDVPSALTDLLENYDTGQIATIEVTGKEHKDRLRRWQHSKGIHGH
jgi:hypothetical protein